MKIYTHYNVDLDNVFSSLAYLLLCKGKDHVIDSSDFQFVEAGFDDPTIMTVGDVACDVKCNKHPDGISHFTSMFKDNFPSYILKHVGEIDSTGKTNTMVPLSKVISALRLDGHDDLSIMKVLHPIVKAFMNIRDLENQAPARAKGIEMVAFKCYTYDTGYNDDDTFVKDEVTYKFTIIDNSKPIVLGLDELFKPDLITGNIFYKVNEMLGVSRFPDNKIDLNHLLSPYISNLYESEYWFLHPSGFLVCNGSNKSKTKCPSEMSYTDLIFTMEHALAQQYDLVSISFYLWDGNKFSSQDYNVSEMRHRALNNVRRMTKVNYDD